MRLDTKERLNRLGIPVSKLELQNGQFTPAKEPSLQNEIDAKALPEIPTECPYGIAQECPLAAIHLANEGHKWCIGCAFRESRQHGIDFDLLKARLFELGYDGPETLPVRVDVQYRPVSYTAKICDRPIGEVMEKTVTKILKEYTVMLTSDLRLDLGESFDESNLQPGDMEWRDR